MTGPSTTERFNSLDYEPENEVREIRSHPEGWECSHVSGAILRQEVVAKNCLNLSPAEVWTVSLSQYTLAKGERLMEYICKAKCVNNLPYTQKEKEYVDRLVKDKKEKEPSKISSIDLSISNLSVSARLLGKLGGQAKSEAKTMSSRSNGNKGGRPKSRESRLDMEDI